MATTLVAWAVALAVGLAVGLVGMDMAAAAHLPVADTSPTDFTEKPREVLQDSSSYVS